MKRRSPQECLTAALEELRAARAPSKQLRRDSFAERVRRVKAGRNDREQLTRQLLESAKIDVADLERKQKRTTTELRAYLDEQRRRLASEPGWGRPDPRHHGKPHPSPGSPAPGSLTYELITLDTATEIVVPPSANGVAVYDSGRSPQHNFVNIDVRSESQPPSTFEFDPGNLSTTQIDFMFAFTAQHDLQLNALAFVQPKGFWTLFAGWSALSDGIAGVRLDAGLDVWAQDEAGQIITDPGGRDQGLDRTQQAGLFDLTGEFDWDTYTDASDLFYSRYLNVKAGTFVVFDVWVSLEASSLGNAYSSLEFASGGEISVPAVYVPTFR